MKRSRMAHVVRVAALSACAALTFFAVGDRAITAPPTGVGIDPFDVLDLEVKNNVLIIVDTSGSMKWPSDKDSFSIGGDDPASRLFQAKDAIKQVIAANQNRLNLGLATYNALDSDKTLVTNQQFDQAGADGPFVYVSADGSAANFYIDHTCPSTSNTQDGFFCRNDNTFANYSGNPGTAGNGNVWRSFFNRTGPSALPLPFVPSGTIVPYGDPYPAANCTNDTGPLSPIDLSTTMRCRYYIQSRLIRNNVRYSWNRAASPVSENNRLTNVTSPISGGCPAPPAGLLGYTASTPICFQFHDDTDVDGVVDTGEPVSTFYYTSALFQQQSGSSCAGAAVLNTVAPCSSNNSAAITAKMDFELPVSGTGTIPGLTGVDTSDGHLDGDQPTAAGIRADQQTPLAGALNNIRTATTPAFPAQGATGQRNYVILVTDGDDTCAGGSLDENAVAAAEAAEQLYIQGSFNPSTGATTDFRHQAETMVVAFAASVSPARANAIGQGGSGAIIDDGASTPGAAVTGCRAGAACRNAFTAQNTQQLVAALTAALQQAVTAGEFSAARSVFDAIPEYVNTVPVPSPSPSFDPMNPESRYTARAFRTYSTTFEMPTFKGHVKAFGPTSSTPIWDAGTQLLKRLDPVLSSTTSTSRTFADLHGGLLSPSPAPGQEEPPDAALIHRRIFTNARNGIAPAPTSAFAPMTISKVMLWPPTSAVAPSTAGDPAGSLDNELGIGDASSPVLTFAQLQLAPLRACRGTPLPAACTPATTPPTATELATQLARARREAREQILAYAAGAQAQLDAAGDPVRNSSGEILYVARPWLLAETTLASPAVVTPPIQTLPLTHTREYILYRDGPRIASGANSGEAPADCGGSPCLDLGFGLRNPDNDGTENPPNTGANTDTREDLKPVMSVLYIAANDMLHAFRAGPCPTSVGTLCTPAPSGASGLGTVETGGEELYAFVPYDLLGKLRRLMEPQTRENHTFMLASGLRFAEVFVPAPSPGTFTLENQSYTGRWRRILVFGRGMGSRGAFGKYYTALDITAPGPFTESSLDTQLPDVWWSRGNPDFQTITSTTRNGSTTDETLFQNMGMTWSVPAVSRVNPANNVNPRLNVGREYVVYTGSGYGDGPSAASEGTRFYTLDAITGDIIASADVGEGGAPTFTPNFENALVAPPVTYIPDQLVAGRFLANPSGSLTTAVYIGDIHGRVWKFDANAPGTAIAFKDLGRNHPIAVAAALINLGTPHVFVGTGYDMRVPVPSGNFQLAGIRDTGSTPGTNISGFPIALGDRFRAAVPPRTAFEGAFGVALFVGVRFNPATTQCASTFDSILFAVNATNGNAVYDLVSGAGLDVSRTFTGDKVVGEVKGPFSPTDPPGRDNLDQGIGIAGAGPDATTPPPDRVGTPTPVTAMSIVPGSSVCR